MCPEGIKSKPHFPPPHMYTSARVYAQNAGRSCARGYLRRLGLRTSSRWIFQTARVSARPPLVARSVFNLRATPQFHRRHPRRAPPLPQRPDPTAFGTRRCLSFYQKKKNSRLVNNFVRLTRLIRRNGGGFTVPGVVWYNNNNTNNVGSVVHTRDARVIRRCTTVARARYF